MSRRVQIVLPDPVADQLYELAGGADTPSSTLAAPMVRNGVAEAAKDGKVRPVKPAPVVVAHRANERAPWLEPYGGDRAWRRETWGAVVANRKDTRQRNNTRPSSLLLCKLTLLRGRRIGRGGLGRPSIIF
jgi:hypothetical protein